MASPAPTLLEAYADQGAMDDREGIYRGTDSWEETALRQGDRVAQIEYRGLEHVENGTPYSRYFTSVEEVERWTGPDGKVDIAGLSERLQVTARPGLDGNYQYNAGVSIYEVTEDFSIPTARVTDNPHFGVGGAVEYFAPDAVIDPLRKGEFIQKVDHLETTNRAARLPVFEDIRGLDEAGQANMIETYREARIDALDRAGDPVASEVAEGMIKRRNLSGVARTFENTPEALRAEDFRSETRIATDLDPEVARGVQSTEADTLRRVQETPNNFRGAVLDPDGTRAATVDRGTATLKLHDIEPSGATRVTREVAFDSVAEATAAFREELLDAGRAHPEAFRGGLPDVHLSADALEGALSSLHGPAWARGVGNVADEGGRFLGRASKVLVKDVAGAKEWLEDRALEAGQSAADYARSRWEEPERLAGDARVYLLGASALAKRTRCARLTA